MLRSHTGHAMTLDVCLQDSCPPILTAGEATLRQCISAEGRCICDMTGMRAHVLWT